MNGEKICQERVNGKRNSRRQGNDTRKMKQNPEIATAAPTESQKEKPQTSELENQIRIGCQEKRELRSSALEGEGA